MPDTLKIYHYGNAFIDCNFDSIVLAKFDADADYLDEDVDFTFDDFEMPEKFKLLQGML